jgi:hypothetical protein
MFPDNDDFWVVIFAGFVFTLMLMFLKTFGV